MAVPGSTASAGRTRAVRARLQLAPARPNHPIRGAAFAAFSSAEADSPATHPTREAPTDGLTNAALSGGAGAPVPRGPVGSSVWAPNGVAAASRRVFAGDRRCGAARGAQPWPRGGQTVAARQTRVASRLGSRAHMTRTAGACARRGAPRVGETCGRGPWRPRAAGRPLVHR
jgi:hypothetical protein